MKSSSDNRAAIAQNNAARAFVTQYTAIFLIILAFMVGAYAQRGRARLAATEGVAPMSALPTQGGDQLKSEIPLPQLFSRSIVRGELLNTERLAPLAELLRSHDLVLSVDLYASPEYFEQGSSNLVFDQSVARAEAVRAFFDSVGIPTHSVRVTAFPLVRRIDGVVRFERLAAGANS